MGGRSYTTQHSKKETEVGMFRESEVHHDFFVYLLEACLPS